MWFQLRWLGAVTAHRRMSGDSHMATDSWPSTWLNLEQFW
jgi:hypothetical protein